MQYGLTNMLVPKQYKTQYQATDCLSLEPGCVSQTVTWSDSKLMRLVPKKSFILFIHQLKCGHLHPLCLHTPFPAVLPFFVAFLESILWDVV